MFMPPTLKKLEGHIAFGSCVHHVFRSTARSAKRAIVVTTVVHVPVPVTVC